MATKIQFQKLRLKKYSLVLIILFLSIQTFAQSRWKFLFDGQSLNGWEQLTGKGLYTVEGDAIVGTSVLKSPNSFLAYKQKFPGDFILTMQAMVNDTLINSGVQYKSNFDPVGNSGKGKIWGYQYDIDPKQRKWSGGVYEEGRRAWLYQVTNPKKQVQFTINKYHKIKVKCVGNNIKTWLDGKQIANYTDTLTTNQGLIALQIHSIQKKGEGELKIYWKNIRIKQLN